MSENDPTNPFANMVAAKDSKALSSTPPSEQPVESISGSDPKSEELSPAIVYVDNIVYRTAPYRLLPRQIAEIKQILKDSGADSSSQISALERIRIAIEE